MSKKKCKKYPSTTTSRHPLLFSLFPSNISIILMAIYLKYIFNSLAGYLTLKTSQKNIFMNNYVFNFYILYKMTTPRIYLA
ncbi:unnamed protein product [Meloidogyne enterolobii]|uniref:Uncharacterized protein n=1 Tax=Meloidogyne enterolobii TaxID=390850 RepID=A0ACB0XLQ7_MELEN